MRWLYSARTFGNKDNVTKFPPWSIFVFLCRQVCEQINDRCCAKCYYRGRTECCRTGKNSCLGEGLPPSTAYEFSLKLSGKRYSKLSWHPQSLMRLHHASPPHSCCQITPALSARTRSLRQHLGLLSRRRLISQPISSPARSGHLCAPVEFPLLPSLDSCGDLVSRWRPGCCLGLSEAQCV